MPSCCSCNGRNAVCKRCVCARAGRPCSSCLPMSRNSGVNVPSYRRDMSSTDGMVLSNKNGSSSDSQLSRSHVSRFPESARYSVCSARGSVSAVHDCNVSLDVASVAANHLRVDTAATLCNDPLQLGFMDSSDVCYDTLMCRAYGSSLSQLSSVDCDSDWHSCWKQVIYHSGNHYILPGGSIGR